MGNTILLADKSITIQKIVELTFAEEQFEIKCVNDGQAALDLIPQVQPDIILADISLPVKSGYEVCRAVRNDPEFSALSGTPVILLAGIYETMDEERARQVEEKVKEVGANDLLSKPFDPQLLTAKVKDLMIQKSLGTFRSESAAPTEAFSFDANSTDPGLFSNSYDNGPSLDDTGNFQSSEEPEDDVEKTMILSAPPAFGGEMFAEKSPFEGEEPIEAQSSGNDNGAGAVDEQLYDASDLQADNSQGFFQSDSSSDDSGESLFEGSPEISSSEMSWTDPAGNEEANHYSDYGEGSSSSYSEASSMPSIDEPFSDVLQESAVQSGWDSAGSGDEEVSPFGLPEPPPEPQKVEDFGDHTLTYHPEKEDSESAAEPSGSAFLGTEPVFDFQEPAQEPITEVEVVATEVNWYQPQNSDPIEVPESKASVPEPDQEKTEPEIPRAPFLHESEEAVELQPDLSEAAADSGPQPGSTQSIGIAPVQPGSNPNQFEITDELIDRIVEKVIAKMSLPILSDIVWQVVPDLAEKMIRRELEKLNKDNK